MGKQLDRWFNQMLALLLVDMLPGCALGSKKQIAVLRALAQIKKAL